MLEDAFVDVFRRWVDPSVLVEEEIRDFGGRYGPLDADSSRSTYDSASTAYLDWVLPKLSTLPVNHGKDHLDSPMPWPRARSRLPGQLPVLA